MDKTRVTILKLGDATPPSRYWRTRPVVERLAMVESLRNEYAAWRRDHAGQGFQRVYRIAKQQGR